MENFLTTGNIKLDCTLLGVSWFGSLVSLQTVPIILSSIASLLVIYNQYKIARKKHK